MNVEIEHVQLEFIKEIDNNICALRVQSNLLCFALRSGLLFLIDLDTPSAVSKFEIPLVTASNNAEKLIDMWMSPNGKRLFLKTNFAKYYICEVDSVKQQYDDKAKGNNKGILTVKKLIKKNCDIRVVNWIDDKKFLCGTVDGQVYFVDTVDKHGKHRNDPDVCPVYRSTSPIDGVFWSKHGHFIVASGNKIMYWRNIVNGKAPVLEEPAETEEFEHLHKDTGKKFDSHDDSFAWITHTGVVFGKVGSTSKVLSNAKVLLTVELPESKHNIRDIILTDFHMIILRGWTVTIINKLSNAIVFDESIWNQTGERMLGLTADYSQDPPTFWCFSTANIYEIILHKESQAVWKLLCDQKDFETALSLKGLNEWEKEALYYHKGSYLLDVEGKSLEAAKCLGLTSSATIGSVALRLLESDQSAESIQTYLTTKLDTMDSKNQVQRILISSWIMWNFMKQLNDIDEKINTERNTDGLRQRTDKKEVVISQLEEFLKSHLDCLDKETIYQVLAEQNRKQELLFFANLLKDYQYVLSYWVRQENWYEALKVLLNMQDPESVYNYASVLLVNSPEATVNTWMKIEGIKPVELIPPILTYFTNYRRQVSFGEAHTENYALNYLMWSVEEHELEDSILYNTILYMMITRVSSGSNKEMEELQIIRFLDAHDGKYDKDFLLRLSVKFHKIKVSIYLYSRLNLYEDAVTLALDNKMIDSAKLVVKNKDLACNFSLKRRIWLKIGKAMLYQESGSQDIKQTIRAIISESDEVLEIKDLLPLFDEFTTIANLKDELIRSLEKHGQSMSQISEHIKQSLEMKKDIQKDIEAFRERYNILEPGVLCSSCEKILQTRKFLVFPCGHCFHTDCLIKAILNSNDYNLRSEIENFQRRLAKNKKSVKAEELESLITTKCCLCSDININSIDEPIDMSETEAAKWLV